MSSSNGTPSRPKLLVVDDDEEICTQMKWALHDDYEILVAGDRATALKVVQEDEPPVVLLDLGLPPLPGTPEEGFAAMSEILAQKPFTKVIIISGQGEKNSALRAIGAGAYDFVAKPVEVEELRVILKRTFHVASLEKNYHDLQQHVQGEVFENMVGTSPQMQQVFNALRKVA